MTDILKQDVTSWQCHADKKIQEGDKKVLTMSADKE